MCHSLHLVEADKVGSGLLGDLGHFLEGLQMLQGCQDRDIFRIRLSFIFSSPIS